MKSAGSPSPQEAFALRRVIVKDIARSTAFYRDVFEARVLRDGEPMFLRFGNIWLTINGGGGPTDDKPEVTAAPPPQPNILSYELWRSRGASEIRCYIRDPDGYLIEVGQTTFTPSPFSLYATE